MCLHSWIMCERCLLLLAVERSAWLSRIMCFLDDALLLQQNTQPLCEWNLRLEHVPLYHLDMCIRTHLPAITGNKRCGVATVCTLVCSRWIHTNAQTHKHWCNEDKTALDEDTMTCNYVLKLLWQIWISLWYAVEWLPDATHAVNISKNNPSYHFILFFWRRHRHSSCFHACIHIKYDG